MDILLTINGEERPVTVQIGETLLAVLRRQGYAGVKRGCEDGSCGVCAVLLDGQLVHACILLAVQAEGHAITTIEGIGTYDHPHPLQTAFVAAGAVQCGYCSPAMILAAASLLQENPHPTEAEVREALSGVLCRCTGYVKPVAAILRAAQGIAQGGD